MSDEVYHVLLYSPLTHPSQLQQALEVSEKDVKDASSGVLKDLKRFQNEKEADLRKYMVSCPSSFYVLLLLQPLPSPTFCSNITTYTIPTTDQFCQVPRQLGEEQS